MKNFKMITLTGRVGSDVKTFKAGESNACDFSLASNDSVKTDDGWQDKTDWFKVVVFGKQADFIAKHLKKGKRCLVSGAFSTGSYVKDGEKRLELKVKADSVEILDWETKEEAPF